MKLSEAKYIFTTRIELDDKGNFIELREPNSLELKDFGEDGKANFELLKKLFPSCIVDHSFEDDDGKKAKPGDVAKVIAESGSLYTEIIQEWLNSIPFGKRRAGKSDK